MIDSSVQDLTLALEMTRHRPLRVCDRLNLNLVKWTVENTNIRVWVDPRAIFTLKWVERVFSMTSSTHVHAIVVSLDDVVDDPGALECLAINPSQTPQIHRTNSSYFAMTQRLSQFGEAEEEGEGEAPDSKTR